MNGYDDYDDFELEDLRAEQRAHRRRQVALMRNPDCRDPDHPGCPACSEEFDDDML